MFSSFYGGSSLITLDTIVDRLGYEPSVYSLIGTIEDNVLTLDSVEIIGSALQDASLSFNVINNVPVLSVIINGITYNFTGARQIEQLE